MSMEKPWEKSFDDLLKLITLKWPGAIRHSGRKTAKDMSIYPSFVGTKSGLTFEIEISEFPDRKLDLYEAEDNVEYLRVFVSIKNAHTIRITHENFAQRMSKFLRLTQEFQTGSKVFDKKYWLELNSKQDEDLICNRIFQDKVYQLEPLTLVEISKIGILWSLQITKKSQLSITSLEKRLNAALAIAAIIAPKIVMDRPVPITKPIVAKKPAAVKKPRALKKSATSTKAAAPKKSSPGKKAVTAKKQATVTKPSTKKTGAKKIAAPAKVRCAGITTDGKQCKLMVKKTAKYCHLHKKKKK